MEEDIKELEEYTKHNTDLINLPEYDAKIVYKAIRNLIARYKELEGKNIYYKEKSRQDKNRINKLEQEIKLRIEDTIPKSKVKEKIEEIKNRRTEDGECELALHGFQREAKIQVLQELLD